MALHRLGADRRRRCHRGILVGMLKQPVLGALLLVALKLAFDLGIVNKAVVGKERSQLQPMRRFIISQEDDASRP